MSRCSILMSDDTGLRTPGSDLSKTESSKLGRTMQDKSRSIPDYVREDFKRSKSCEVRTTTPKANELRPIPSSTENAISKQHGTNTFRVLDIDEDDEHDGTPL